ncbi:superfamily II DNA or RNA helicase [Thermosporothrix hazakensis]|jgi:superfamily II DNA or RNA helicase|uniref:Superfamily II DNA or RNA helicase n=1 Tax=Thermosporothrix hazakensis TaxID=644383 RepID=A0A326U2M4_THEHA|nr:DEAD/DEAH box helicase [Thermosporothrix hazakensis]PZW19664.1 superfamily II DNA or RNA helicase [Thermosporothrix hazakensis]GCE49224.1 hypothetical protein KTH_40930 [Thermosporothrix hazakensis]
MELRPYQQECVEKVINQYKQFRDFLANHGQEALSEAAQSHLRKLQTALIVLPTGGGKTIVFSSAEIAIRQLLENSYQQSLNTLIIAHRQELLKQARDKYHLLMPDMPIGLIGDGVAEYGAPVTVASIATISRPNHLKNLKRFGYDLVIIDEAHHAAANGYQAVLDALPDAFRLFVTATPDRLDGKPIIEHEPLYSISIIDMIQQGFLCNLRAKAVRTSINLDGIKTTAGDYNERQLAEIIDSPNRNKRIVQAYQEHAAGRPFVCFAVTVAHAEHIADEFSAANIPVGVVSGKTPSAQRERLLKDFEDGKLQGLINCGVLTEGYDYPGLSCVIMARPTKSRALFIQCIGRGLRLAPAKSDCVLLDMSDNTLDHRLEPVSLSKALGIRIKDDESVLEAVEREEKGKRRRAPGDGKERRIKLEEREKDLTINLVQRFAWTKNDHGYFVCQFHTPGQTREHRVALIPDRQRAGMWRVAARLAPTYRLQWWQQMPMELDDAQQVAEREMLKLQADPSAIRLVDRLAPWRVEPATPEQIAKLDKWHVPYPKDANGHCAWTRGQASDAIASKLEQFKKRRKQKTKTNA